MPNPPPKPDTPNTPRIPEPPTSSASQQLAALAAVFDAMKAKNFAGVSDEAHTEFHTRCLTTAARLGGTESEYVIEIRRLLAVNSLRLSGSAPIIYSVIRALKCDIDNGFCKPKELL